MAKGSKIVCVRIEAKLLSEIEKAAARTLSGMDGKTANLSGWIKKAIAEKLHNRQRSVLYRKQPEIRCFLCDTVLSEGRPNKQRQPENVCLQCREAQPKSTN